MLQHQLLLSSGVGPLLLSFALIGLSAVHYVPFTHTHMAGPILPASCCALLSFARTGTSAVDFTLSAAHTSGRINPALQPKLCVHCAALHGCPGAVYMFARARSDFSPISVLAM